VVITVTDKHSEIINQNKNHTYQIRIKGHLGAQWSEWFDGMTITLENNGDTLLTGLIADQSELHSLLRKIRDLGIPLISVVDTKSNEFNSK